MTNLNRFDLIEAGKPWLCIAKTDTLEIFHKDQRVKLLDGFTKITALMIVDDTVFVADDNVVMIIDLYSYAKKLLVKGVAGCYGFEFVHTNLFMALANVNQLAVVNIDTLQTQIIVKQERALSEPHALAFDADRLWVLNSQNSSLSYMLGRELFYEAYEGTLNNPLDMTLGRYGDGCGVGRLFIADTDNDQVKVYNPEDKTMQVLIEKIKKPASISKSGCKLYMTSLEDENVYMFDLKSMTLETLELQS